MRDALRDLGLTDGEIDVYLALFRHGESAVSDLAHYTGHHRTHIYDVCEKLLDAGFISTVKTDGVQHFRAAPAENLLSYLDEQRTRVEDVVEELRGLEGGERALVESYKGRKGVKAILRDMLNTGEDFVVFGVLEFERLFPVYIPQFVRQMDEKEMSERAILPESETIIRSNQTDVRHIDEERLPPTAAVVYGGTVAQFVWKEPYYAIRIEDEDVAKSYENHFEMLWEAAG